MYIMHGQHENYYYNCIFSLYSNMAERKNHGNEGKWEVNLPTVPLHFYPSTQLTKLLQTDIDLFGLCLCLQDRWKRSCDLYYLQSTPERINGCVQWRVSLNAFVWHKIPKIKKCSSVLEFRLYITKFCINEVPIQRLNSMENA